MVVTQTPDQINSTPPRYAPLPFTILVDTAEQHPFTFTGIHADANLQNREYLVERREPANVNGKLVTTCLGQHPNSYGDYSIEGYQRRIAVERKSIGDVIGTVCGWGERRERFLCELKNLQSINMADTGEHTGERGHACVVVEGSFEQCVRSIRGTPNKTKQENRIAFHRSIISLQQEVFVPWYFCDSRRFAEVTTFRFLEKAWRKLSK